MIFITLFKNIKQTSMKTFRLSFSAAILAIVFLAAFNSCKKEPDIIINNYYNIDTIHPKPVDTVGIPKPEISPLVLTHSDNNKTFTVFKGQKIILTLGNPGDGGFSINPPAFNAAILSLSAQSHTGPVQPAQPPYIMGDFGTDTFHFIAQSSGTTVLTITCSQYWDGGSTNTMFTATINVQ